MYSSLKDKYPPSPPPTPYVAIRRIVPRHTKSYLWLGFLAFVFGLMLLSENGVPVTEFWPRFGSYSTDSAIIPASGSDNTWLESTTPIQNNSENNITFEQYNAPSLSHPVGVSADRGMTHATYPTYGSGLNTFTPDEVLILIKTGATTLYRRLPIHLTTTLSNPFLTPHYQIYSDQADHLGTHPIVDVLANISQPLRETSPDFTLYRTLPTLRTQNLYPEAAAMEGDHYLPGGWRLDKYKFLPLIQHAATHHPGYKWYIYMEDDTYLFWHTLYTWLGSTFDPSKPYFLGSPAAKLGEDFAHGGSGFMISGAAMSQTFGADPNLADKFEGYAADHCCGDQVLSHVMKVSGVPRYRGYDDTSFIGLQALQPWKMAFGRWNWCSPLVSVHKVHQADVSRLYRFEQHFHETHGVTKKKNNAIMNWSHLFRHFVAPTIFDRNNTTPYDPKTPEIKPSDIPDTLVLEEWDNLASEKWHTSSLDRDESLTDSQRELQPWFSASSCARACDEWELCLTWKFQDDHCGLSSTVSAGNRADEGVKVVSGYLGGRIREVMGLGECGGSKWVPGS